MRIIFKTDYDQDIRLFKHGGYWASYAALMLVAVVAPLLLGSYLQSQIVFGFIYSIVGVGLLILTGFTAPASLGHSAFLAIRDSEEAAKSMAVNVAVHMVSAFAISAAITALAGCLYAHKLSFISTEMSTLLLALEFIIVIIIGGPSSLHGPVLGSIFVV